MQQQQAPQIDITATTEVSCECGNPSFKEVMYIRKESRLMSGLPEDRIVPIQLIACDECGELLEAFIPVPLKQLYGKDANKSI